VKYRHPYTVTAFDGRKKGFVARRKFLKKCTDGCTCLNLIKFSSIGNRTTANDSYERLVQTRDERTRGRARAGE
jgi:hypothetical protein